MLSETRKPRANEAVLDFLRQLPPARTYISVLTLGELRKGLAMYKERHPEIEQGLSEWIDGVEYQYADRVLDVSREIARLWGELSATRSRSVIDTLLASTAIYHGMTLVTRNVRDVEDLPVVLQNPWLA